MSSSEWFVWLATGFSSTALFAVLVAGPRLTWPRLALCLVASIGGPVIAAAWAIWGLCALMEKSSEG